MRLDPFTTVACSTPTVTAGHLTLKAGDSDTAELVPLPAYCASGIWGANADEFDHRRDVEPAGFRITPHEREGSSSSSQRAQHPAQLGRADVQRLVESAGVQRSVRRPLCSRAEWERVARRP